MQGACSPGDGESGRARPGLSWVPPLHSPALTARCSMCLSLLTVPQAELGLIKSVEVPGQNRALSRAALRGLLAPSVTGEELAPIRLAPTLL